MQNENKDETINETVTENTKPDKKKKNTHRKVVSIAFNLAVLMVGIAIIAANIVTLYPYAITANDEVICYVDCKDEGAAAVKKAVQKITDKDSDILAFSVDDEFSVTRVFEMTKDKIDLKSSDDAAKCIAKAIKKDPEKFPKIEVASEKKEIRTFTPDPVYELDENAFAGTTVIKDEGKDGRKEVTVSTVSVNGEVIKEEDIEEVTLDEGRNAVIVKGKLGLPEGEDWKTYEGDPVYRDGEELIKTAQSYVGKVQYVRGGTSLVTGLDCVGFVIAVYRQYGVKLSPHLRREGVGVSYSNAQPGDILCFSHHYGIYIGNGKMVDAANPREDVRVAKVGAGGHLIGVRRIIPK